MRAVIPCKAWGTVALPGLAVAGSTIEAQTWLLTVGSIIAMGAGLIAGQAGPAGFTCALARHWVAALGVLGITLAA